MVADPGVFRDLAYVFVAAVVGGGLARLARQPLILGYVFAGILVGPLTPGPAVSDVHNFEVMAEIGVALLMFSIGVELSLKDMLAVRRLALVGAPLGLAAFIGLSTAVALALGWSAVAGVSLGMSGSDYAHDTLARLLPLRDIFAALFFVTMGMLLDPALVFANLGLLGVLVALVIVGNLVVWTVVVRLFGESLWNALLTAAALTQIGEFSFVLVQVARHAGHVGGDVYNATLAASLLTILINALFVQKVPAWIGRMRLARSAPAAEPIPPGLQGHVVLGGYGRVGSAIGEALETFGIRYVAIEKDRKS